MATLRYTRRRAPSTRCAYCAAFSAALIVLTSRPAFSQDSEPAGNPAQTSESAASANTIAVRQNTMTESLIGPPQPAAHRSVEQDLTVEGMASYGNYKIFASGYNCKLYTVGIEYDRNSWGRFLGARMDYSAEFIPVVILRQPAVTDIWGNTKSANRKTIPGVDLVPIGFRLLWRDQKAIKPYLTGKGGFLVFTQKALSNAATYENFSLQSATGLQIRMNDRFDLRLGLFGDFHFSDGFIVPVNPGLDVMNAMMGITYHLGSGKRGGVH